jgi:hypothetical protein
MKRVNFVFAVYIALILLVLAVLSIVGVVGSSYSKFAWIYTVIVGAAVSYLLFLVLFGDKTEFDSSQGLWDRFMRKAESVSTLQLED